MTNEQIRRHLVAGLVGDRHMDLWHHNPIFKTQVDSLVDMLPLMMDGIAAHCRKQQGVVNEALQHLSVGRITLAEAAELMDKHSRRSD